MAIETLDDWNAIIGQCCCEMPSCPAPTQVCEDRSVLWEACGWNYQNFQAANGQAEADGWDFEDDVPCPDRARIWNTVTRTVTSTNPEDETVVFTVSIIPGTDCDLSGIPNNNTSSGDSGAGSLIEVDTYSGGVFSGSLSADGFDYGLTLVFSDQLLPDIPSLLTDLEGEAWDEEGGCIAAFVATYALCDDVESDQVIEAEITQSRFKWVIPDTWTGSYFKITWDVVFFPADESTPTILLTDQTWEWTGPGPTWDSGWYTLDPPEEPGEVRVVNVRYECYRSTAFGGKPQVTGEAYEIPV
jgi:hypothetical protein